MIEQIIARDNLERPASPPIRMPAQPTAQRSGLSTLKSHLPLFRRRVDSSDEDEPKRPVWPPRSSLMNFDDGYYKQEDTEPEPPRRWKNAQRRLNSFIEAVSGVDGDASNDVKSDNENDYLDGFIVFDDVEY